MTCSYGEIMMDEKMKNMQRWIRSKTPEISHKCLLYEKPMDSTHTLVSTLRQLYIPSSCTPLQEKLHQCGRTHGNINTTTDNCVSQQGIMGDETT